MESRSIPAFLAIALVLSTLHDVGSWRLRRSDADVRLFRERVVPALRPGDTVAVEQIWRIGGRIYLPAGVTPADIDGGDFPAMDALPARGWLMLDVGTVTRLQLHERLQAAGFDEVVTGGASAYRIFRRGTGG